MRYRFFISLMLSVLALIGMAWVFSDIFTYLVISLVLTTLLRPLVNIISRVQILKTRIPRVFSIMFAFSLFIGILVLFIRLFVPLVSEQVKVISNLDFNNVFYSLSGPVRTIEEILLENDLVDNQPGFLVDNIRYTLIEEIGEIDFTNVINNFISTTGNVFIGFMAVLFISSFLLYENGIIRKSVISIIPNKYFEVIIGAMYKTERLLSYYLLGLLFQMLSVFTLASVGLSIFSVKYALTIALFAAFANLIPYLGPLLGATFGILVSLSTTASFGMDQETVILVIKVISVFAIVQVTDNVLLQPLIFSKSIKAHPLEIFIIIFAGAAIGEIIGMIVAIPVYTILRVTSKEVYAGFKEYRIFQS